MSEKANKPGILSWVALSLGLALLYLVSAAFASFLIFNWDAPEQIMVPFLPIRWLIEFLIQ